MQIKFLGTYSGESKQHKLLTFIIDDILVVEAASISSELTFPEQRAIKAILLSHCHYDHVCGLPAFAFNSAQNGGCETCAEVLALPQTLQMLTDHFFNEVIYPNFTKDTSYLGKPSIKFRPIEACKGVYIDDYRVTALPATHTPDATGFEIVSPDAKSVFYTGDTGPGFAHVWERISPQLVITETTFPDRLYQVALASGHLCPKTLEQELGKFKKMKGYLPKVIVVHMNPQFEKEICKETGKVGERLSIPITIAREGDIYSL